MKVYLTVYTRKQIYLPAITGYVPDQMVECIAALLDFSYLARRPSHTSFTLDAMSDVLHHFHTLRTIFEEVSVRPDGFSLPRQHALVHYVRSIKLFGSPNGLCSSITESKHINVVKRPWRASNRRAAIGQIIRTLTRCAKIAATRIEFGRRGMLRGDVFSHALRMAGFDIDSDDEEQEDDVFRDLQDAMEADEDPSESDVVLPARACRFFVLLLSTAPQLNVSTHLDSVERASTLANTLYIPRLVEYIRRFLFDQLNPDAPVAGDIVDLDGCPYISPYSRISIYRHATATFYAPSELAGPNGMHREIIRSNPRWFGGKPRYDTILIDTDSDAPGLDGMTVARVLAFVSFTYADVKYDCAVVEWFETDGDGPDIATGMWIVQPELDAAGERVVGLVHVDSIVRACHLIGVYGTTPIPSDFEYMDTLDAFRHFYVNWYADYHAHEILV